MKKLLALGRQEFSEVIRENRIYVDKTEIIYKMATEGVYYFLSRPRRFGKSLLANTLKELFLGNKELFKGLWIYDKWNWEKKYPVIKISFSNIDHTKLGLEEAIRNELENIAKQYGVTLEKTSNALKFKELFQKLAENKKVVVIIDEYDKPIIDYMTELEKADENRKILKNFYSVIKDSDKYIRFFFVTGVSKFSKVSLFSDLNNLEDITTIESFAQIVGWTQEELSNYFSDYIQEVAERYKDVYSDIMPEIKKWYNGYSWDGNTSVHNPVSIMNFFKSKEFGNYWFATGTPTFLLELIKANKYSPFDLEENLISTKILDKYELSNLSLLPLLFQTGYLTIKRKDFRTRRVLLDYPNFEVEESFSVHLLSKLTIDKLDKTEILVFEIIDSFSDNDIEEFVRLVNYLLSQIPNTLTDDTRENYYHSIFYLIMKMVSFSIEAEILTIKGRIDAVIKTEDRIFVLEFKTDQSAKKAIEQIKDKKYAEKYANDKLPIVLMGINFDTETRRIDEWVIE